MRRERPPRKSMKNNEAIPTEIWRLVESCWSVEVKLRPSMSELVASLVSLGQPVQGKEDEEDVEMVGVEEPRSAVSVSLKGRGRDVKVKLVEPDPEVLSLIENAFKSKLFRDLLLASRGELADKLMCTMQTVSPPPPLPSPPLPPTTYIMSRFRRSSTHPLHTPHTSDHPTSTSSVSSSSVSHPNPNAFLPF